jgi:hypothetical protein
MLNIEKPPEPWKFEDLRKENFEIRSAPRQSQPNRWSNLTVCAVECTIFLYVFTYDVVGESAIVFIILHSDNYSLFNGFDQLLGWLPEFRKFIFSICLLCMFKVSDGFSSMFSSSLNVPLLSKSCILHFALNKNF